MYHYCSESWPWGQRQHDNGQAGDVAAVECWSKQRALGRQHRPNRSAEACASAPVSRGRGRMRAFSALLFCCSIILVLVRSAAAHEAGQGETCGAVEHNVAHTINKQNYSCDKTACTKCNTSGGTISGCTQTTYWENCVAAARGGTAPGAPGLRPPASGGLLQAPSPPPKPSAPGVKPEGSQTR